MPQVTEICIDHGLIAPGSLQLKFGQVQCWIIGNRALLLPMQHQFGCVIHPALQHCGTVLLIKWKFLQV